MSSWWKIHGSSRTRHDAVTAERVVVSIVLMAFTPFSLLLWPSREKQCHTMYLTGVLFFVSSMKCSGKGYGYTSRNKMAQLGVCSDPSTREEEDGRRYVTSSYSFVIPPLTLLTCPVDSRGKKRKVGENATKAPPPKKPTPTPITNRRESVKAESATAPKVTKSDSSFFSAPKPKAKLPSFKKVAVKKEPDGSVAQPMNIDPFQQALQAMGRSNAKSTTPVPTNAAGDSAATATSSAAGTPAPPTSTTSKKRKRVTFPPDSQLEAIRWIDKAIYDDDDHEVSDLCRLGSSDMAIDVFYYRRIR